MIIDENEARILESREYKYREMQFLKKSFKSVISVKTNIPGIKKQLNIAYLLVNYFVKQIPLDMVSSSTYYDGYDGPYFLLGSNIDPYLVKSELVKIENDTELGRFIDIDVFDGEKMLSRGCLRKCYICDSDAFVCAREHRHTDKELIDYMSDKVMKFFMNTTMRKVNDSIMSELELHPKFGCVTPLTSGSHTDMNYDLMLVAKDSIMPYFAKMFEVGFTSDELDDIFKTIRKLGIDAEKDMLSATNGINAYKGLIFNMGILLTAYAYSLYNNIGLNNLVGIVKRLAKPVMDDFGQSGESFGKSAYHLYGFKGARGEAYAGFPSVIAALHDLEDFDDFSKLKTLVRLIIIADDSVLLKRAGSFEEYKRIKGMFINLMDNDFRGIDDLNDYCTKRGLSFGGSADLLVLAVFLKKIGMDSTK